MRPCGTCPWRQDAPLGLWHPDHFRSIAVNCRDDGQNRMLCHLTKRSGPQIICAGWVAVEGEDAVGVRVAVRRGVLDLAQLDTQGLALFPSMDAMLLANGVPIPPRNRFRPKDRVPELLTHLAGTLGQTAAELADACGGDALVELLLQGYRGLGWLEESGGVWRITRAGRAVVRRAQPPAFAPAGSQR